MAYFVYPAGTPSHTALLEARDSGVPSYPYIGPGHVIDWRQDGAIIKTGSTSNLADIKINTGLVGDVNFDAPDTGTVLDFVIDGIYDPAHISNPVILANNAPAISGATLDVDVYGLVPRSPTLLWYYSDADADLLYYYRVKLGTAPGASDIFDSGFVYTDPGISGNFSYTPPVVLAYGLSFHWTLCLTDGEKVNPTDPDAPATPRVETCAAGTGKVDSLPVVSDIRLDGHAPGTVPVVSPVISWTYSDVDGQPQFAYRVQVSSDPAFTGNIFWDSGKIVGVMGQDHFSRYNFDLEGEVITPHISTYVKVTVYDDLDYSSDLTATFVLSNPPTISLATVDDKVNPLNLKSPQPTFRWHYSDLDVTNGKMDPLVSYEIRLADNSADWGTDSFIGNVWSKTEVTPESHEAKYGPQDCLPCHCCFYGDLHHGDCHAPSPVYYFQVQVKDAYEKSPWFTGFLSLNNPPCAANARITPPNPHNNDSLTANYDFIDNPGETESDKTEIRWYKDGTEVLGLKNLEVVPAGTLRPNDRWYFTVRPHDGTDYAVSTLASPEVIVQNRRPTVTNLSILPAIPKTEDDLNASYLTSDQDGDPVSVTVRWYKNGAEQQDLRGGNVVPASLTTIGDEWRFTATPNDGYEDGDAQGSDVVIIINTPPVITALMVDGGLMPGQLDDANPKITWLYQDADEQPQAAYRFILGTKPARTRVAAGVRPLVSKGLGLDGVISTSSSHGTLTSGNEMLDTGIVQSADNFCQYSTPDFLPAITMGPLDAKRYDNYVLEIDSRTFSLGQDQSEGKVDFTYVGLPGTYEVEMTYVLDEKKKSRYRLSVDGLVVDEFVSGLGNGESKGSFKAARLSNNSILTLSGFSVDVGSRAKFIQLRLVPAYEFEIKGGDFKTLLWYVADDNDFISLLGGSGTATTRFPYPSGAYDVELFYLTESSGQPVITLSVGGSQIMNFQYETGAMTRSKVVKNVQVNGNDIIKISGTADGGAKARIEKLVFRPAQGLTVGSHLKDGYTYYASVQVSDGLEWSDWYTTKFSMKGSAWVGSVSNNKGWTIEARFSLKPSPPTT